MATNHDEIIEFARKNKDEIALKPKQVKKELLEITKKYIERFGTNRERIEFKGS